MTASKLKVKVEVLGAQGAGKTRFVNEVLLPALKRHALTFTVLDEGQRSTNTRHEPDVDVVVRYESSK